MNNIKCINNIKYFNGFNSNENYAVLLYIV